jgi:glycosyltransferase involved in cell wall biosynthesis
MSTLVVLCSHNGERFIAAQIESIRAQTRPVDAIHVFDFGSSDSTPAILRMLARDQRFPPVLPCFFPDAPGAAQSFFRAFGEMASTVQATDCIFLADQDDVWLDSKVETLTARFETELALQPNQIVAVFHDVEVVDQDLRLLRASFYTGNPFAVPRDLTPTRLLLANPVVGHTIAASGELLRQVARNITHRSYLMHDWATVLLASRFGRVAFVPKVLSMYRQHDANVLGAFGRRRARDAFARTLRFARGVIMQSCTFVLDADAMWTSSGSPANDARPRSDRQLARLLHRMPAFAPAYLAGLAALTGPTWQRRALAAALLLAPLFHGRRRGAAE